MPLALGLEEVLGPNPDPEVITKLYKKCKPNHFVAAPTNILQIIDAMNGKSMRHCRKMLPSHSIPGKYIILDEIPLTQSGKTDYRALEKMKID